MVVLTRERVAPLLTRVLVAPVTTTDRGLATEALGPPEGLHDSVASLGNVHWCRSRVCCDALAS
ncbi:MAG: hypothetical protein ACR2MA_01735, partial [Egibacteraceae bacterium]